MQKLALLWIASLSAVVAATSGCATVRKFQPPLRASNHAAGLIVEKVDFKGWDRYLEKSQ